eukprot:scaffold652688_cov45-Prasinocladus_malaysianus.AAC.1
MAAVTETQNWQSFLKLQRIAPSSKLNVGIDLSNAHPVRINLTLSYFIEVQLSNQNFNKLPYNFSSARLA